MPGTRRYTNRFPKATHVTAAANAAWKNKTALICGATSGLGLQLARTLVAADAQVLIIGRDPARLADAQKQLQSISTNAGTKVHAFSSDLCVAAEAKQVAERISAEFAQLDLVINAVGASDRGSIETLTCERMLDLVRTNVGSGLHVIQNFAPLLRPTRGTLVLIGSLSSHFAPRFLGGYSIAKHGLAALAQQARLELADSGVHVMLASPGPIARTDTGSRYSNLPQAADLPPEALKGGGGAKVKGLDPQLLSAAILSAAHKKKSTLIMPSKAKLLLIASAISPSLGEYLLRKFTS